MSAAPATIPSPSSAEPDPTETIDGLLQRYLALLDEYTALRGALGALQADLYQSLARANYHRGGGGIHRRYGQDDYDGRMQASRRVRVCMRTRTLAGDERDVPVEGGEGRERGNETGGGGGGGGDGEDGVPVFTVGAWPPPSPTAPPGGEEEQRRGSESGSGAEEGEENEKEAEDEEEEKKKNSSSSSSSSPCEKGKEDKEEKEEEQQQQTDDDQPRQEKTTPRPPTDPLRWFGILTPLPLRQAQGQAIRAVEEVIPRLASVSAEMARVELEVRRARKRRAKAEKRAEGRKRLAELAEKMGELEVRVDAAG